MQHIITQFQLQGTPVSCERYGNGHINETRRTPISCKR